MYHSAACGIEDHEEETLIITGGYDGDYTGRVTKYNKAGIYTDLPILITARASHGCGHYRNSNNQKVGNIVIVMNKIACFKVKLSWTRGLFFVFPR